MENLNLKEYMESVIDEREYDLSELLPRGVIIEMMESTGASRNKIKNYLSIIKEERDIVYEPKEKDYKSLVKTMEEIFSENDYNVFDLPYGVLTKMSRDLGKPPGVINYAYRRLKKENRIVTSKRSTIIRTIRTPIYNACIEQDLLRNSNQEGKPCHIISNYICNYLPRGGYGLLIGTPTAFCASKNCSNNMIQVDNLIIAAMLEHTTIVSPTIVIGSALDAEKARKKADDWKSNNATNKCKVITDKVDRDSFSHYVTTLAGKSLICKVVLLTSGNWEGTTSKSSRGLDLNFKDPSLYLTSIFPKLHILALVRDEINRGFKAMYLNNGNCGVLTRVPHRKEIQLVSC